jgi:undecaprenyl-diphosphatase
VILWNSRHNWVMFRHDLGHTKLSQGWSFSPWGFLDLVGGQLAALTPILCVLMLYLLLRRRREDPFCFWLTIPILLSFVLKSLQGKVQANWPLPAWLAALAPLADFLVHQYRPLSVNQKRLVTVGLVIPAVGTLLLHMPFLALSVPWPGHSHPLSKLLGWRQLGAQVTQIAAGMNQPFIFSDYYMTASELAFYVEDRPRTYCVNLGRRMNQYDVWAGLDKLAGREAVYITQAEMPPDLRGAFDRVEPQPPITIRITSGRVIKSFGVYHCYGFRGWTHRGAAGY